MDKDILILLHKIMIDIASFDESSFGILDDEVRACTDPIFLSMPDYQRQRVIQWACERSLYSIQELIDI